MAKTTADTIRDITEKHINNGGIVMGQCLTAVGWVQNTVPRQTHGIYELPMTDIAGAGMAVGAAIMGKRPIFIIRFQSFLWLNASPIVNYAAKSKEIFNYPAPVFVRAIASEGGGSGPLHTNCFHSLFMHMPGMTVSAPLTPSEYKQTWAQYKKGDSPILVSEHRESYSRSDELEDINVEDPEITIFGISASRYSAIEAVDRLKEKGINASLFHITDLKPLKIPHKGIESLSKSKKGLVCDSAFEICGASESIAYELMLRTQSKVKALGMFDRSSGVAKRLENHTPTAERIVETAEKLICDR